MRFGECVVWLVGVRHVGGQAFDNEVRELAKRRGQRHSLIEGDAEAVQAGIDLDVDGGGAPEGGRRLGEGLAERERVAGERDPVRDRV